MKTCACKETLLETAKGEPVRVPSPEHHDCDYVRRRSALVHIVTERLGNAYSGHEFTRVFAREMERAVRAEGLL